jgi:hypothetical protein
MWSTLEYLLVLQESSPQQLDIYGPARAVKGLSRGKTRFRTDAVIYPTSL